MKPEVSGLSVEIPATKVGLLDSSWVAPVSAPSARPSRADRLLAHSDSLSHTDGGSHVDAHGDHGDK